MKRQILILFFVIPTYIYGQKNLLAGRLFYDPPCDTFCFGVWCFYFTDSLAYDFYLNTSECEACIINVDNSQIDKIFKELASDKKLIKLLTDNSYTKDHTSKYILKKKGEITLLNQYSLSDSNTTSSIDSATFNSFIIGNKFYKFKNATYKYDSEKHDFKIEKIATSNHFYDIILYQELDKRKVKKLFD